MYVYFVAAKDFLRETKWPSELETANILFLSFSTIFAIDISTQDPPIRLNQIQFKSLFLFDPIPLSFFSFFFPSFAFFLPWNDCLSSANRFRREVVQLAIRWFNPMDQFTQTPFFFIFRRKFQSINQSNRVQEVQYKTDEEIGREEEEKRKEKK